MARLAGVIAGGCALLYVAWAALTAALALVVNLMLLGLAGLFCWGWFSLWRTSINKIDEMNENDKNNESDSGNE